MIYAFKISLNKPSLIYDVYKLTVVYVSNKFFLYYDMTELVSK